MVKFQNDRLMRVIRHQPVDATPIWIMRQAGRYLPEYRELRKKAGSFMSLCKTPELACTVTLQPLARFPLDAAILFSDILTIPDAMGLGLSFQEGEGPYFERPLRSARDILALGVPDPEMNLRYVLDAIRMIQHELAGKVPLIGFCGSPWTIATYMVPAIESMMQEDPQSLHRLLDILARSISLHLNAQIKAGVQIVMIFDTWGGMLTTANYQKYSLHYVKQIIAELNTDVPIILFTKKGGQWLELMAETGCDVVGVDWLVNLSEARERVGAKVTLQGNMDPNVLHQSPEIIRAEVAKILDDYGANPGHIFNLGHGITPGTPLDNVAVLIDAVHTLSQQYHKKNKTLLAEGQKAQTR